MTSPSTPSSPTTAARVVELATLMRQGRQVFIDNADSFHWRPQPGSLAEIDQRTLASVDPAVTGGGISAGFDLIAETVVTFLEIGAGHLAGMGAVYEAGEVYFPPAPLARSVLENCARIVWVLGTPSDTAKDRLARAYLEEFYSSELAKAAAGHLSGDGHGTHLDAKARWKKVRTRAKVAFPDAKNETLGRYELGGQTLPKPEAGTLNMFKRLNEEAGGTLDETVAKGVYEFLSSGTHPTLYQARQLREYVDHGDHHGTVLRVDLPFLERLAANPIVVYYNAIAMTLSYFGTGTSAFKAWEDRIELVFPGTFN